MSKYIITPFGMRFVKAITICTPEATTIEADNAKSDSAKRVDSYVKAMNEKRMEQAAAPLKDFPTTEKIWPDIYHIMEKAYSTEYVDAVVKAARHTAFGIRTLFDAFLEAGFDRDEALLLAYEEFHEPCDCSEDGCCDACCDCENDGK